MLTTYEQAEQYKNILNNYLDLREYDTSAYIETMAKQVISTLMDRREFHFSPRQSTYYDDRLLTIKNLLTSPISDTTIELIHFELAKTLRYVSALGSDPNFNSSPIVQFYARPKLDEIPLSRSDEIIFGIAHVIYLEKIERPFKELDVTARKVDAWGSKLDQWEKRSTEAQSRYQEVVSGNNYLGLSHAFERIVKRKTKEATGLSYALKLVGFIALCLPMAQLITGITKETSPTLTNLTFSIAVEIILIYYFRLIHSRWTVLKNQISQLELRSSMCAFVHDYAAKSKDLERETLMKFENMIFSDVISDNSPPPSIYDAADSIAKLLGAWKKPGP